MMIRPDQRAASPWSADMSPQEPEGEELTGGKLTRVTRVGETVRRAAGPGTPAVHALLRHLADVGFPGAPRVLDLDADRGIEVLSYIPGMVGIAPPLDPAVQTDAALVAAARLIRRLHDAVATFSPPPDARWQFMEDAPRVGPVICHNDIAAYNLVYSGGEPVALIDSDFAAPADPAWDLA